MKNQKLDLFSFIKSKHPHPKNGVVFGNFGALNLGDEAILSGELDELMKFKSLNIQVIAKYPKEIKEIHGIQGIYFQDVSKIVRSLISADFVIFGGGGLFCKSLSGIKGKLFQLYFILLFLILPKLLNKKVYVIGVGIYKNMGEFNLAFSTFALRLADYITVRDPDSQEFLKNKKIKSDLFIDSSYSMKMPITTDRKLIREMNVDIKVINIGLGLKYPSSEEKTKILKDAILTFISRHKEAHFWFYSLDNNPFVKSDIEFNKLLITILEKNNITKNIHIVPSAYHPREIFSTFKQMDFIIAMRLHSMIFAHRMGVEFVGISYDAKCDVFLNSLNKVPYKLDNDLNDRLKNIVVEKKVLQKEKVGN